MTPVLYTQLLNWVGQLGVVSKFMDTYVSQSQGNHEQICHALIITAATQSRK